MPKFIQFQVVDESFNDLDGRRIEVIMMYALSDNGEMWSSQNLIGGWTEWGKMYFENHV